jgi:hypothetical protein
MMQVSRDVVLLCASLALLGLEPASERTSDADGAVVVDWSQEAYEIAFAEDSFRTFRGHRAFAMMHLAMHDAVNAATPVYAPYAFRRRDLLANPVAAAAQAAHDVLLSQYPRAAARLAARLHRTRGTSQARGLADRSVALGRATARAVLEQREGDGWSVQGRYEFHDAPGDYRTTPPWDGFVVQPAFRSTRPFTLTSPSQFRPGKPPTLESSEYAESVNEVRRLGARESRHRTADQTAYAIWWMEFAEGAVNRLARRLVTEQKLSLAEAARLFALLNAALFDTYVAVWDSKYEYNLWRPFSAIRLASTDGNPATDADTSWVPLRPTPPFPEYVSAHAAACAVTFDILGRLLGDRPFAMETITAPPDMPLRHFPGFHDAARECADSRVQLGFHFRFGTNAGLVLGNRIAAHVVENHLQALR